MHSTRSVTFSFLALVVLVALSGQAFAGSVVAGSCPGPGPHYATIQAAVTAAGLLTPPNTVRVCPGNYYEQVVINQPLTLEGIESTTPPPTQDAAVILPPTTGLVPNTTDVILFHSIAAQLLVKNTAGTVSISNLTVDGTGNGIPPGCLPVVWGILFQNASGTVNHVAARNQVPSGIPTNGSCGGSIFVQTGAGFSSTVTVENSSVHNYNGGGIIGNWPGTTLTVTGSYVQGSSSGMVPTAGIQLCCGAKGKISGNTVIDNIAAGATDIFVVDTAENSGITVSGNIVGNSPNPILLYDNNSDFQNYGDGVTVTGNKVFGTSTYDAIDVCTNGNTITKNTIVNSSESGVHLDASCGIDNGGPATGNNNTVTGNTILESACAGILEDSGTTGNTTGTEVFYTVPFTIASSTVSCALTGAGPTRAKAKFRPVR